MGGGAGGDVPLSRCQTLTHTPFGDGKAETRYALWHLCVFHQR
jgi:hypothetical protein